MRSARLIILAIALVAGVVAFMLVRNISKAPETEVVEVSKTIDVMQVLVAAKDMKPGSVISPKDLEWQDWPQSSIPNLVRKDEKPDAMDAMKGAVVRSELVKGEPIRLSKVVSVGSGGYLSAVLPPGKRAISTAVSPETGAGGFILPNDRVDVIMTRRFKGGNEDQFITETVLENIRVLAIDQSVEEKDGESVVVGETATLQLTPRQAEVLTVAQQMADRLALTLRSVEDSKGDKTNAAYHLIGGERGAGTVRIIKYGSSKDQLLGDTDSGNK